MLRVKAERLNRRWTQTTLAARAGFSSAAEISLIETGRLRPSPLQLGRLARAFRTDGSALLDEVGE